MTRVQMRAAPPPPTAALADSLSTPCWSAINNNIRPYSSFCALQRVLRLAPAFLRLPDFASPTPPRRFRQLECRRFRDSERAYGDMSKPKREAGLLVIVVLKAQHLHHRHEASKQDAAFVEVEITNSGKARTRADSDGEQDPCECLHPPLG